VYCRGLGFGTFADTVASMQTEFLPFPAPSNYYNWTMGPHTHTSQSTSNGSHSNMNGSSNGTRQHRGGGTRSQFRGEKGNNDINQYGNRTTHPRSHNDQVVHSLPSKLPQDHQLLLVPSHISTVAPLTNSSSSDTASVSSTTSSVDVPQHREFPRSLPQESRHQHPTDRPGYVNYAHSLVTQRRNDGYDHQNNRAASHQSENFMRGNQRRPNRSAGGNVYYNGNGAVSNGHIGKNGIKHGTHAFSNGYNNGMRRERQMKHQEGSEDKSNNEASSNGIKPALRPFNRGQDEYVRKAGGDSGRRDVHNTTDNERSNFDSYDSFVITLDKRDEDICREAANKHYTRLSSLILNPAIHMHLTMLAMRTESLLTAHFYRESAYANATRTLATIEWLKSRTVEEQNDYFNRNPHLDRTLLQAVLTANNKADVTASVQLDPESTVEIIDSNEKASAPTKLDAGALSDEVTKKVPDELVPHIISRAQGSADKATPGNSSRSPHSPRSPSQKCPKRSPIRNRPGPGQLGSKPN
jgi:hypothetical protein